ncbi:hypothetical protein FZC35_02775 [Candidatus Cytomitobacter indipagum]|uniref:HAD family hydrolase n=1 Tax=Candidatus Cytomitobacter indipagum TaxID=2601575 RepID=A0A5C0UG72_9PROT|nr:haloacid dehalogenase-like hydrolase [Candidatus Cytomitobacter indipagum]QEK38272.1 hypothetical protein FZC35_02775 [Candidatus Cytomitobacter indipagum]
MQDYSHIFVDLDGTLIKQNISLELFKRLIIRHPLIALKIQINFCLNKKQLNIDILGKYVNCIDIRKMQFHNQLLKFLKEKKKLGKKIVLATGSPVKLAEKVNFYLNNLFDDVIGSYGKLRCVSKDKLVEIEKYPNKNKFMYIGNSNQDIEVWLGSDLCGVVEKESFAKLISEEHGINFDIAFKNFE